MELKYHKNTEVKNKIGIFIEYVWLTAAALSLIGGVHKTYYHGFEQSWLFFVITPIALLMFYLRRHLRKQNLKEE